MDQALTFDEIFVGRQYKVVKIPSYWTQRYPFEYIGKIGECEWKNSHTGICLKLDANLDLRRQFPPECLKEVEDTDKVLITGDAEKIELTPETVKLGALYKVVSVPSWYIRMMPYRPLYKVGKCINIYPFGLMLSIPEIKAQCYVPFNHIEEVKEEAAPKLTIREVKLNALYKIISIPSWYSETNFRFILNEIGKCMSILPFGLMLLIPKFKEQWYVPFQNVEEVKVTIVPEEITDKELISKMISNPLGALKIVRGLAKMNRNLHLRSFLEQGTI